MDLREHKPSAKRMLACLLTMCLGITATYTYIDRFTVTRSPAAEASRTEAKELLGTLRPSAGTDELSALIDKRLQEVAGQDSYYVWTSQDASGSLIVLAAVELEPEDERTWSFESAARTRADKDGETRELTVKRVELSTGEFLQKAIADDLRAYAKEAGVDTPGYHTAATNEGVIIMVAPDAARVVSSFSLVLAQNKGLPIGELLTELTAAI